MSILSATSSPLSSEPIRTLITDDSPLFRLGVIAALSNVSDIHLIGECDSAKRAIEIMPIYQPDIVLMDISFIHSIANPNGIEATRQIVSGYPHVGVIILTGLEEDNDAVFLSLRAGARGYLKKGIDRNELLLAIRSVAAGKAFIGAETARRMKDFFDFDLKKTTLRPFPQLTEREYEVLGLMAQGKTNLEIAQNLDLTDKTIRNYVSNVLSKLQVSDRIQAAFKAHHAGIGKQ